MGYYYYGRRRATPTSYSVFDGLTLSPLPYPVLLILAVICTFLGISWYSSYEDVVETAEEHINWLLLAIPISIIFVVKWLSSMEDSERCFRKSVYDRRGQAIYCGPPPEGRISPWGVAGFIILLLVLIQYQSIFLDSWFI